MTNIERFREVYTCKLSEAMDRHPTEYAYPKEQMPTVVERMLAGFARGSANVEGAGKATARALGIKPTIRDIKAFLNAST